MPKYRYKAALNSKEFVGYRRVRWAQLSDHFALRSPQGLAARRTYELQVLMGCALAMCCSLRCLMRNPKERPSSSQVALVLASLIGALTVSIPGTDSVPVEASQTAPGLSNQTSDLQRSFTPHAC